MSAIFALANQKGGVAKTTTTGILAAGLKKQGFSVLTIDCDPQGNLSMSVAAENQDSATMYEVMKGTVSAREAIQHTPSCDIIPANTILAGIEQELHNVGKEMTLREKLRDEQTGVAEEYDYILIDCPPSLGLLTVNALTAADYLLLSAKFFLSQTFHSFPLRFPAADVPLMHSWLLQCPLPYQPHWQQSHRQYAQVPLRSRPLRP